MGYSHWNNNAYSSRQTSRKKSGKTAFTYDAKVRKSGKRVVHKDMNPYGKVRESRDSAAHPDSVSIAVLFDVTGSMGIVPRVLQTKLGALMKMLISKGYVEHPQILFGANGDAYCDAVPLQIGQFESGLEMDDDLGKIFLEGGGGGQMHETYELGLYFMARHTSIDCYEKRGKKGYLFTIGDEKPYDVVRAAQVRKHIGDKLEVDIPVEGIIAEVREKYEYFHIMPTNAGHGDNPEVQARWRELVGERLLMLDDEAAVCETIALAIGLCEGTIDNLYTSADSLVSVGYDADSAKSATVALAPYAKARGPVAKLASGTVAAVAGVLGDGRL